VDVFVSCEETVSAINVALGEVKKKLIIEEER
jgi:hypothetical protein